MGLGAWDSPLELESPGVSRRAVSVSEQCAVNVSGTMLVPSAECLLGLGLWMFLFLILSVRANSLRWKSTAELEPGRLVLSWTPRTDHVVFQVEARTLGYVGVGFSRDGSLNGADIVIGWIEDDNQKAFLLVSVLKIL